MAITTSGGPCAPTVSRSDTSRGTRPTGSGSRRGRWTVPDTVRNPLYHWTHMELQRPFGLDVLLSPATAREVFDACNERLCEDGFTIRGLLREFRVAVVCTTDDPADSLESHRALAARADPATRVYPTWRSDRILAVDDPVEFNAWVARLEAASGRAVGGRLSSLLDALRARHETFHDLGCRASDLGLEAMRRRAVGRGGGGRDVRPAAHGRDARCGSIAAPEVGAPLPSRRVGPRARLGAAVPSRRIARHQLAAAPPAGPGHRLRFDRRLRAGPPARAVPGPARRHEPARQDHPVQQQPARQRAARDDGRQLPGRQRAGQAPARRRVVVPRPRARHHGTARRAVDGGPPRPVRRHGHRFAQRPARTPATQYFRRVLCNVLGEDVRRGRLPDEREQLGRLVRNVCFFNARDYFGFRTGRAAADLEPRD